MYKTIFSHIGNYKKQAILAPVTIIGEVAMEVTIPLVMAHIIDDGIRQGKVSYVAAMGGVMVLMALFSLIFGALSGRFSARFRTFRSRTWISSQQPLSQRVLPQMLPTFRMLS